MTIYKTDRLASSQAPSLRQKSMSWILVGPFAILIVSGLLIYSKNNALPVQDVLILVLILLALCGRWTRSPARMAAGVGLALYGTAHLLLGLAGRDALTDVAQAHKWVFFVALLFFVERTPGLERAMIALVKALLLGALVKSIALIAIHPGSRLGLLAESNFEITMYCMLVAVTWEHLGRRRFLWVLILAICAGLSLSRSGAIAFFVLVLFILLSSSTRNRWFVFVRPLAIAASVIVPVAVFAGRGSSVEDSDRAHFLNLFLEATRGRGVGEWFLGAPPITALPDNICANLSYYSTLFASDGSGACYSVVLHVFVLRVLFDFGLLGLLLSVALPFLAIRSGGVRTGLAATLSTIAFVNGLSVSGVNSEFVILPMALAIYTSISPHKNRFESETDT